MQAIRQFKLQLVHFYLFIYLFIYSFIYSWSVGNWNVKWLLAILSCYSSKSRRVSTIPLKGTRWQNFLCKNIRLSLSGLTMVLTDSRLCMVTEQMEEKFWATPFWNMCIHAKEQCSGLWHGIKRDSVHQLAWQEKAFTKAHRALFNLCMFSWQPPSTRLPIICLIFNMARASVAVPVAELQYIIEFILKSWMGLLIDNMLCLIFKDLYG